MIKHFCDFCLEELGEADVIDAAFRFDQKYRPELGYPIYDLHLCGDCYLGLVRSIDRRLARSGTSGEKEKPEGQKDEQDS